jgi:hypothetical protein
MSSWLLESDSGNRAGDRGAELHIRADRWLAFARRGRSTWRSAQDTKREKDAHDPSECF